MSPASWFAALGCTSAPALEPAPTPALESAPAVAPAPASAAPVWVEVPAVAPPAADLRLYWPGQPSWDTILLLRQVPPDPVAAVPWGDPVPAGAERVEGLLTPAELAEVRRRVASAGAPLAAPPELVRVPLEPPPPDLPPGQILVTFRGVGAPPGTDDVDARLRAELGLPPDPRGSWWRTSTAWLVGYDAATGTGTLATWSASDLRADAARADAASVRKMDEVDTESLRLRRVP